MTDRSARSNQPPFAQDVAATTSILAIDPGLNSMGWAFWRAPRPHNMLTKDDDRPPHFTGLIKAPRKLDLPKRALWIAKEIERESMSWGTLGGGIGVRNISIVSEFPEWMGIQLGWAAGDLQKLVFLVGMLAGYLHEARTFELVKPGEWKGQLPKSVVNRRLRRRFGAGAVQDWDKDMWDAVGIGMWSMGRF